MSVNATVSKTCPVGFVFLVPGRISMNSHPVFSAPPAEEEIVIDAMTSVGTGMFINPTINLTLLGPAGCEFLPAAEDLRPNDIVWTFPDPGDNTKIQAAVNTGLPELINRGNSKSFRFAIKGRAGRDISLQAVVSAQPVSVEVDSCTWTIADFGDDTTNLGQPLDLLLP